MIIEDIGDICICIFYFLWKIIPMLLLATIVAISIMILGNIIGLTVITQFSDGRPALGIILYPVWSGFG